MGRHELEAAVDRHYGHGGVLAAILAGLRAAGKDTGRLAPADLAPVDEFHIRGREATLELARRAELGPGMRVLDVGCGLGGSARHLALEHGCRVVGVDLTAEYVEAASALAERVGLAGVVEFRRASALELPFDDGGFDAVWTEHVQMNVPDKARFYGELARVLAPGGRLLFHDVFQGPGGEPHFPVPWAGEPSISALVTPEQARATVEGAGLVVSDWEDRSASSLEWFEAALARTAGGPPPLGLHLLMGASAREKLGNVARNLREERIAVVQAVAVRG